MHASVLDAFYSEQNNKQIAARRKQLCSCYPWLKLPMYYYHFQGYILQ